MPPHSNKPALPKSSVPAFEITIGEDDGTAIDDLPFSILTKLYADLRNARQSTDTRARLGTRKQTTSRYGLLTSFWLNVSKRFPSARQLLSTRPSDQDIIPAQLLPPPAALKLICLLVPQLDPVHAYLGMKETKLADSFVRALDLPAYSDDAQWLKHYKERAYRPRKWRNDADIVDGNLPSVIRAVMHGRCPTVSSLTVGKVWDVLDLLSQTARVRNRRIVNIAHAVPVDNPDIDKMDAKFESFRKRSASLSDERKHNALASLVEAGTAEEVAEVAHIILKDLNMRLSQDNFFNWFHPAAKQHYTQIHDIRRLLKDCHDPSFDIGDAAVQLGQYASVMLTMRPSRRNLPTICEKLLGGGIVYDEGAEGENEHSVRPYFIMEPKLDGERLQLHMWKRQRGEGEDVEIRTFSRRGNDSSAMYADALHDVVVRGVHARDVILDGEIMIWDDLRASWLRFEDMREVTTAIARRAVPEGSSYTLKFMVFDVLYVDQGNQQQDDTRLDGNMVMRFPLRQRRELLEKIVKEERASYTPGAHAVVEVVGMQMGHDDRELTDALQRYEQLGYEGVIAKHPDRPYVLAERNFDISIKLKPDYFDGGITDVDVLILGAKYSCSHGNRVQRAGKLSSFLIGVRSSHGDASTVGGDSVSEEEKGQKTKWIVVGSVGSGYSDRDLAEIQSHLEHEWRDFDAQNLPDHFEDRKYLPQVLADVAKWVQPWKSVVLTVRAFELHKRYHILRFPRVERVRWDKAYYDVSTMSHLLDVDETKPQATIKADEDDVDDVGGSVAPEAKRRRGGLGEEEEEAVLQAKEEGHQIRGGRNARSVIGSSAGANVSKVERLCDAFDGVTFHVVGADAMAKANVEVKIHELGGRFVQNLTSCVDFIIGVSRKDEVTHRVLDVLGERTSELDGISYVEAGWIERCRDSLERSVPGKTEVIMGSAELEKELYKDCDRFGDSWEKDADVETFEYAMNEVAKWQSGHGTGRRRSGEERKDGDMDKMVSSAPEDVVRRVTACAKESGLIFSGMVVDVVEIDDGFKMAGTVGLLQAFGATLASGGEYAVTHVLVPSTVEVEWRKGGNKGGTVITDVWVRRCIDRGRVGEEGHPNDEHDDTCSA